MCMGSGGVSTTGTGGGGVTGSGRGSGRDTGTGTGSTSTSSAAMRRCGAKESVDTPQKSEATANPIRCRTTAVRKDETNDVQVIGSPKFFEHIHDGAVQGLAVGVEAHRERKSSRRVACSSMRSVSCSIFARK